MRAYVITKEESDRIRILKYISIIFVAYIHSYATQVHFSEGTSDFQLPWWLLSFENLISQVVARCAVPIFFLISSILLFKTEKSYKETIVGKVKTLVIPYLFWNSFWIFVFILLQSLPFTKSFFSGNNTPIMQSSVSEWLALYGVGFPLTQPHAFPLWYMRDLMVATLFFPIIGKIASKVPKTLLAVSVILLLAPFDFPFKEAFLWLCVGACLVNLQIHMTIFDGVALWKFSLFYVLCAFITLIVNRNIMDNLFVFVGVIYWIRASKYIFDSEKKRNFFVKLSKWGFIIYATHELTMTALKKVCFKLLPAQPIWLLMIYLILPIVVVAGCSVVGAVFKKVAPKLYSITTGAR